MPDTTIAEALLAAVRRRSIARQRLVEARNALQAAQEELIFAENEVRDTEYSERKELPL